MSDQVFLAVWFLVWLAGAAPLWWVGIKDCAELELLFGLSVIWAVCSGVISLILGAVVWSVSTLWHAVF